MRNAGHSFLFRIAGVGAAPSAPRPPQAPGRVPLRRHRACLKPLTTGRESVLASRACRRHRPRQRASPRADERAGNLGPVPATTEQVLDALRALPGVMQAFRSDEIGTEEARTSSDVARRAAALSYHPARSGDFIIVPRLHWMLSTSSATTHGTLHAYDQRVPVIFYGAGVPAGNRRDAATPADLAPTLATLAGVPFTPPDGKPLIPHR